MGRGGAAGEEGAHSSCPGWRGTLAKGAGSARGQAQGSCAGSAGKRAGSAEQGPTSFPTPRGSTGSGCSRCPWGLRTRPRAPCRAGRRAGLCGPTTRPLDRPYRPGSPRLSPSPRARDPCASLCSPSLLPASPIAAATRPASMGPGETDRKAETWTRASTSPATTAVRCGASTSVFARILRGTAERSRRRDSVVRHGRRAPDAA